MKITNNAGRPASQSYRLPSREELHKTFAGVLYEADFSTDRPSPWNLNRISQTLCYATREREAETSGPEQENEKKERMHQAD